MIFFFIIIAVVNDDRWLDGCYFCYTDLHVCHAVVTHIRKLKGKALGSLHCQSEQGL